MLIPIETHHDIDAIAAEWEALAERSGASPFMRPGWIAAWQRSFGRGRLSAVCARRDGDVVGVIPVGARHGVLGSPTNWHTPSFEPLAEDAQTVGELAQALLAMGPHTLDLAFFDPTTQAFEQCQRTAQALGYRTISRVIQRSPYIELASDFESFESSLPARRRGKIRRFRRRLEEQGSVSIELERGDRDLEALLTEGFALEASGWKGERGTAVLSSPTTVGFYRDVAAWAATRGWLRLWFLRLDGRAIAFAFCLEHGGAHYELKVGFDHAFARFGPGVVLTRARIEHSFSAGLRSYEFLGQPEPHKLDWTSTCRDLSRLQAFAPTLAGLASRLAWTRGRNLALKAMDLRRRSR